MEDIGELSDLQEEKKKDGFFKYVFNFDEYNKNSLLNLFQYSFIAIPMIIIILKVINHFTPEEEETKGSLVIIGEILGSVTFILISIWFINKIIRFIPTYSKENYKPFNEINFILPLFIILFTLQTKLGAKINILVTRLIDLIEGKTNLKNSSKDKKDYKTTQPISQVPGHQISQADQLSAHTPGLSTQHMMNQPQLQQQNQNFNQLYNGPTTPLVNAATPSQNIQMMNEPMAANETVGMFGGSIF